MPLQVFDHPYAKGNILQSAADQIQSIILLSSFLPALLISWNYATLILLHIRHSSLFPPL